MLIETDRMRAKKSRLVDFNLTLKDTWVQRVFRFLDHMVVADVIGLMSKLHHDFITPLTRYISVIFT